MLKIPEVFGVAEARDEMRHILEDVEKGHTFIIKGTKGREALVINAAVFRRLQDAYTELVGELETLKILQDERAMRALEEASDGQEVVDEQLYTLSEVERMVGEVEDFEGAEP
jgi:PHD/YefM family antitoxin component YafN of YafNO toxin-antitoxin module